ncbi:hypothetical protein AZ78_0655 [Lysobacter capsici AZ78]|uniref:Uncharacterized protein n=1 Tax=Lysobacter capsici AZ78 TaxID=1444315 RepID=A0A108U5U7_9GAMM|nr:hypothetical protein AZ78_0655 [Lysobacter capsici AZ78]
MYQQSGDFAHAIRLAAQSGGDKRGLRPVHISARAWREIRATTMPISS